MASIDSQISALKSRIANAERLMRGSRHSDERARKKAKQELPSLRQNLFSLNTQKQSFDRRQALLAAEKADRERIASEAAAKAAAELADKNKASDGTTIVAPPAPVAPPVQAPPTYTPTPAPAPTPPTYTPPPQAAPAPPPDPNFAPDIGYDPISGNPIRPDPTPEQGGDLPPNYVPPPNSRDWLGHVLTPTGSLLPQQLERGGPIRRVTPVSQLFNNPLNSRSGGAPTTAMGDALRGGSNGQV